MQSQNKEALPLCSRANCIQQLIFCLSCKQCTEIKTFNRKFSLPHFAKTNNSYERQNTLKWNNSLSTFKSSKNVEANTDEYWDREWVEQLCFLAGDQARELEHS